jgi:uncharacterized damage-inducible protein DinB
MKYLGIPALLVLHDYNDYANRLVFETAARLSEDAFTSPSSPSHGSVRGLLRHMLGTEFYFLGVCQGSYMEMPPPDEILGLLQLVDLFAAVACRREKYLKTTHEADILAPVDVKIGPEMLNLPRWQLIAQALMGSAHHRGELSIVMTALGQPLPTLDPIVQFVQLSGQVWPV